MRDEVTRAKLRPLTRAFSGSKSRQMPRWQKTGLAISFAAVALGLAALWAAHSPYTTPGTHRVFHMDSTPGAMLEFLVLFSVLLVGLFSLLGAPRGVRICGGIAGGYLLGVMASSLVTPQKIVSAGDSYCWDLWCAGVGKVTSQAQGANILYTADISLFADSAEPQQAPIEQARRFFYIVDERGRKFPILPEDSFAGVNVTLKPGESAKSSLAFLAPANAGKLYLTGDIGAPWWVRLYFGSDLNPLHRRTLLRIA